MATAFIAWETRAKMWTLNNKTKTKAKDVLKIQQEDDKKCINKKQHV